MKTFYSVLVALVISVSGTVSASDNWYLGATAGHYVLDSDRAIEGDFESNHAGLQLGRFVAEDVAIELGYGYTLGHDDFDVITLTSVMWMGEASSQWRPYVMLGLNQYDFDTVSNLAADQDDETTQVMAGMGVGTDINDAFQFRADLRGMVGWENSDTDFGVQMTLSHEFGKTSAPAPVATPVAAPVAAPVVAPEPEVRTITIRLNVEFEFNKDTVLAVYGDQLEAIAAAMAAHSDIELVLEGHTDSRGSDDYNKALSDRRARAVKAKLAQDYGIAANRISAVGYGESRPIASNETDEGRARNRRVVGEMSFSEVAVD